MGEFCFNIRDKARNFDWCDSFYCHNNTKQGVSLLELCLMIAMKRLEEKDFPHYHFEHIFQEQSEFASNHYTHQSVRKPVCWKAFEHLVELELVKAASSAPSANENKQTRFVKSNVMGPLLAEIVKQYPDCPTTIVQWTTKWLS